jgi:hypothetical protein
LNPTLIPKKKKWGENKIK